MDTKKSDDNKMRTYARFSGMAFRMGIIIVAGALGGQWLDNRTANEFPTWTLILTLLAIFIALYLIIQDVRRMGKDQD